MWDDHETLISFLVPWDLPTQHVSLPLICFVNFGPHSLREGTLFKVSQVARLKSMTYIVDCHLFQDKPSRRSPMKSPSSHPKRHRERHPNTPPQRSNRKPSMPKVRMVQHSRSSQTRRKMWCNEDQLSLGKTGRKQSLCLGAKLKSEAPEPPEPPEPPNISLRCSRSKVSVSRRLDPMKTPCVVDKTR